MRKFILPLLVAGVVAFTSSQAFAALASTGDGFSESTMGDNHYKKMDVIESGAGHFQLNSAIIKTLGVTADGDTSWGFVTGANPFTQGIVGESEQPYSVPMYTMPCPEWATNVSGGTPSGIGTCQANVYATDPQTDDDAAVWDGIILDDLYSATGVVTRDDASGSGQIEGSGATAEFVERHRSLDQGLDIVFLNGKVVNNGIGVKIGSTVITTVADQRYFNIDQTLDQDVADWAIIYNESTAGVASGKAETMGIYGKLTQLFQLGGEVSSITAAGGKGCASAGAGDTAGTMKGINRCAAFAVVGGLQGVDVGQDNGTATDMFAWQVSQYLVSDVYDWVHVNDNSDKAAGNGIKQNYSSFFQDGTGKAFDYTIATQAAHGNVGGLATTTGHTHPDP